MPGFRLSNLDWGDWLYGLISGFIGGGAAAASSGLVVAGIDPTTNHALALGSWSNVKVMIATFVINGLLAVFLYLQKNPTPRMIQTIISDKTIIKSDPDVTTVHSEVRTETTPVPERSSNV